MTDDVYMQTMTGFDPNMFFWRKEIAIQPSDWQ